MSEMNRRDFLVAAGVAAVATLSLPVLQGTAMAAAAPTMPDKPFDVGELKSFDKDGVTETFAKKPNYVYIVRKDGKLYACLSMCTHKYAALTVKDNEFYCPKHKSEFSFEGTVTAGPAKTSLPRYGISKDDKGHVIVDCSKEFSESKWDDKDSFIKV
jgi:nitrite reductase/ring-hydroxylating ferredoxin subunit